MPRTVSKLAVALAIAGLYFGLCQWLFSPVESFCNWYTYQLIGPLQRPLTREVPAVAGF